MSLLSNGYLLALTLAGAIEFNAEFLVIGGGGDWGDRYNNAGGGGGGAGGYISSVSGESSGGGTSALTAPTLITGVTYSVTVGAAGSNTTFSGTDVGGTSFNHTAIAGGSASQTGGSGGGAGTHYESTGGSGTTGQGYAGGENYTVQTYCWRTNYRCHETCVYEYPGAGGGAGGAGSGLNGGVGVQSSITGTATYYAGGGASETFCATSNYQQGTAGNGASNYGGGGSNGATGQAGVVILRYSAAVTISNPGGGLTMSTSTVGANKVTTITAGTGNIEFA